MNAAACTCPSGSGSQRRPCAAHPPAALAPCPRPFCGAAAALDPGGEWPPSIRCTACGCSLYAGRGESEAALVARWNAPRPSPALALPAFLRGLAGSAGFAAAQQLEDAARLIESQAAALAAGQ